MLVQASGHIYFLFMNQNMKVWAEVDLDALIHNYKELQKKAGKSVTLIPVVKAQAYGCGCEMVSKTLVRAGARCLGVVNVEEAMFLRRKGLRCRILNLGDTDALDYSRCVSARITPSVGSMDGLQSLDRWTRRGRKKISIHINMNTGMNRLGIDSGETGQIISIVKDHPYIRLEGIFSHLAQADKKNNTSAQKRKFKDILEQFAGQDIHIPLIHIENSGGIVRSSTHDFTAARPGIALYGLDYDDICGVLLKPVLALKTRVVLVREIEKDAPVSYNGTWHSKKQTKIAVLSAGYAEGVPRKLSNVGSVLIHGKSYPIAGNVTMDFIMVEIGRSEKIKVGDEAVLIGKSGKQVISMEEVAACCGTISYEIQCGISALVPRIYKKRGKKAVVRKNAIV